MKNNHIKGQGRRLNLTNDNIKSSYNIFIGSFLLLTGIALGITINLNSTFALEGMATDTNATSSNATSSNATSANATSSNATSSNATSANATSSNVTLNDNIMYLNNITLDVTKAKPGDKIYIQKNTSGACNSGMSLTFFNQETNQGFQVNIEDLNNNPYFIIPDYILTGNYKLTNIFLVGLNSDNTTFTKKYSTIEIEEEASKLEQNITLEINKEENKIINLEKINLLKSKAKIGNKVELELISNEKINSLKLIFKKEDGKEFATYANDLSTNPYFTIPTTTDIGAYYLYQAILVSSSNTTIYTNGDNYQFNTNLEVEKTEEENHIYNNQEITEDIIKKIYNSKEDLEIVVNINEDSIISSELFNSIKGTNKKLIIKQNENEFIFNGKDIEDPKSIDANISTNIINQDDEINNYLENGIIINFASNGNLPGKATIKIKTTDEMINLFNNNKIYVYYYDEVAKKFNVIAEEITVKNGYYEFNINHNSKYVLTTNKLSKDSIVEVEDNNIVGFQMSNTIYLLMIFGSIALILVVIAIIIINKNKIKNSTSNKKEKN